MVSDADRPTVLVLMGAFWPGSEASGANTSLRGLSRALGDTVAFRIVARDRAFRAARPLAPAGVWTARDGAAILHCTPGPAGARGLAAVLRETPHDLLWLNGVFDRDFTIAALLLRRLGRVPRVPAVLSPRGEFAAGALGLKGGRKRAWLALARSGGLFEDVALHATGPEEHGDIAARGPWPGGVQEAPNIPTVMVPHHRDPAVPGARFRIVFLGRIARVKNLHVALAALRDVTVAVAFDIHGPVSDPPYWNECRLLVAALPSHVAVTHRGEIANEAVPRMLAGADLLFLPTAGENFGHAIYEALASGVPVLISDRTPWRDLARRQAGLDLPLGDTRAFARAIERFAAQPEHERARWREGARDAAAAWLRASDAVAANRAMVRRLIGRAP